MTGRQRSIARIVALQTKVQTIAAARLAQAEGHKAEITASREDLQRYVGQADLTGALAAHAINHIRALAVRETEAEQKRRTLAEARLKAETKLKLAERVGEAIARDDQAAAERRALERLIEEAVAREATDRDS